MKHAGSWMAAAVVAAGACGGVRGEVRVQDVCSLVGQRTNKLQGIGLVVGLSGTGDGGKYANAMRALMSLHRKYEQPVLDIDELKSNNSVALVMVEVTIPEFGGREGQALDVVVSCLGPAKSLQNGQLLATPLQDAALSVPDIFAIASGRVEASDAKLPTRGMIRGGATLEADFFYNFLDNGHVTLALRDSQAGYPMARMVARAVNHELTGPTLEGDAPGEPQAEAAIVTGAATVRVRVPDFELGDPSGFISRVLQAPLFALPEQQARVVINRSTRGVSFTGTVTISPTVLQIPGVGSVSIGGGAPAAAGGAGFIALDSSSAGGVKLQELLATLEKLKLSGRQVVDAIEQLDRTGTLHAQLVYTE